MHAISLRATAVTMCLLACAPTYEDCFDDDADCKAECVDSFEGNECRLSCETELDECLDEVDAAERRAEVAGGIFELLHVLFGGDAEGNSA